MKHSFHDVGALHKNSKKRDVSCNAKDQNGGLIKQRAPNRAHRAHTAHSTARTARSFPSVAPVLLCQHNFTNTWGLRQRGEKEYLSELLRLPAAVSA